MDNKRLYTFGCSFTKYKWPTWADFIGTQFEIYENWGQPGAGNFFIATQVYECCQKNCIGVDDTVLVMLSSTNRFDIIDRNSNFLTEGNIYNSPSLPKEFVENIWSEEFGIYLTWFAANSIKRLLDGIGCKYKIMTAFDLTKLDDVDFSKLKLDTLIKMLSSKFSGKTNILQILTDKKIKNDDLVKYCISNKIESEYLFHLTDTMSIIFFEIGFIILTSMK
jgi:hypothetical protein